MKIIPLFATLGALSLASASDKTTQVDCDKVFKETSKTILSAKKSQSDILNTVKIFAERYPNCLCEVVKASIISSEADKSLVSEIVETAIVAAPNQLQAIVKCSVAIAPDAAGEIAEVAKQYNDNATVSSKSNLLHLSGKNGSYSGGKNGTYSSGKNGYQGGKNTGPGQGDVAQGSSTPPAINPLDNMGDGTGNVLFPNDPVTDPQFSNSPTNTGTTVTPTPFGDPESTDPTDTDINPVLDEVTPSQP